MSLTQFDVHQSRCYNVTFMRVDVALRHSSNLMSHCNIHKTWCHIPTFLKVDIDECRNLTFIWKLTLMNGTFWYSSNVTFIKVDVALWHSSKLMSHYDIIKDDVRWRHSSKLMRHCNIHESICCNAINNNVFVRLRHSSKLMPYCDIEGICHILTFFITFYCH